MMPRMWILPKTIDIGNEEVKLSEGTLFANFHGAGRWDKGQQYL